jgi:hypothetical protein
MMASPKDALGNRFRSQRSMAIHWWRTDRLAEELAKDAVSERQSLWYGVISTILVVEATYYATWFGGYQSWLLLVEFAVVCVITVLGLQECYKSNGGAGGSHFLKRFICLGVPVGIKLLIASTAIGQVAYFAFPVVVTHESFRNPYFVYQLFSFFIVGVFAVVYYWRIAHHMERIAGAGRPAA